MIVNPIIRKELLSALRSRRGLLLQVLFLSVMVALVWLLWPADGLQDAGGLRDADGVQVVDARRGGSRQDVGGRQAPRILAVLAMTQTVLVALFAPALAAASLTGERERNTLESLFATGLRPWEIALGKMVGAIGFLILLILSGACVLASPLLLGGVSVGQVALAVALLITSAVYLGMIGLLVSSFSHRSYRAIIVTFVVQLVVCFLSAVPAWPIGGQLVQNTEGFGGDVLYLAAAMNPLQAMLSLVLAGNVYAKARPGAADYWQTYLVLAWGFSVVAAVICWLRLRRPIAPPRPRERLRVVERGKVTYRTFLFVIDPRKRKKPIAPWQNPVRVKEFRTRPMLQPHWLLRAIGLCLIGSILLMFLVRISVELTADESADIMTTLATSVAVLMVTMIVLVGPAMTAGCICSDRESGVWDLLRTTRLTSWTIVSGKFQASIIPLLLIALAMMPALGLLVYFHSALLPSVYRIATVVGSTVLLVATAGLCFSSLFRRTAVATAWTYAAVLSISLGSTLMLAGRDLFSQRLVAAMFVVNPVAAALDAAGYVGVREMNLLPAHLKIVAVAVAVMFAVAVARVMQLRRAEGDGS